MKVAREEAALREDLIKKASECDDIKLSIRSQIDQEQKLSKCTEQPGHVVEINFSDNSPILLM